MSHEQNAAPNSGNKEEQQDQPDTEVFENENIEYSSFSDDMDQGETSGYKEPKAPVNELPSEEQIRITILEEELARTKDHMMRAVAEAENGRKRALKERENATKYAVSSFSRDLLSVADNLRRALDSIPAELAEQQPQIKTLIDGIKATERELLRSFTKNGIQKTEPLNERFDPNFHEVMFEAPMPDKQNGIIIQVIEAGYTLNGRILRPARVGIAKNDDGNQDTPTSKPGHNIDTEV